MNQAAIFILITPDNKLLLERKSDAHPREPGKVLLPAGTVEERETPEQTARRELTEEFGIRNCYLELIDHRFRRMTKTSQEFELFYYRIKNWDGQYALDDFGELILVDFDEKAPGFLDLPDDRSVVRKLLEKK